VELQLRETGEPGWVEVGVRELLPSRLLVRVVATLLINGEAVNAATLRTIPVSRIEAMLNQHGIGERLATDQAPGSQWQSSWREEFEQINHALDRYLSDSSPPSSPPAGAEPAREPLSRPDGSDPEGFYRRVAETYSAIVQHTSRPAKVMAEEAGVPVASVHRWIFEARRRGLLPPARQGRAG
jgi:hypothetical protein